MSFNLMDLVKDQLSDQVMGQLGKVLGGSADQNSSAISGAIPGLLSGLINSGSSSAGADELLGAINDQDDSILDNLGDMLGGSGQSSLMSAGSSILGSLLGGGGLGSLVSAIAGFSGLGKGPAKSLLGLLAPIIFGVIKRKLLGDGGLNLSSLMGMLNGQKDNVAAAMPSGFAQHLNASGTTDTTSSNVTDASQNVATEGKSLLGRLLLLALVLGALFLAYNMFSKKGESIDKVVDATKNAVSTNMNVGEELTGVMSSITNSLSGISDVASAKAALPQLGEATSKLGNLAGMLDKLPEAARGPVKNIVSQGLPQIQGLIDKINAIPGVGPLLKPAADGLLEKLALFQ
ncbi:MAG: DUF937 domain-containing protein [Methylococcales bacterium]